MIKTLTFSDFIDEWNNWEDRKNTFSYEGKKALFDYLEEYENDSGEKVELDIIALCCEYTEYDSLEDLQASYSDIESIEQLNNYTQVLPIENTDRFIILNF